MKEKLAKIRQEAMRQIAETVSMDALNDLRVQYLGKKGQLTEVLKGMKNVSAEERPLVGQMVNDTRKEIENSLDAVRAGIEEKLLESKLKSEVIDVTLPGIKISFRLAQPEKEP